MPTHVYQPSRNPPTWWDRLLVHPLESTVAVVAIGFGALIAVSILFPGFVPSNSMEKMPALMSAIIGSFMLSGGTLAIVGLNWFGDNVSTGWALERFGWLVAAGGYMAYSITVVRYAPDSIISWFIPLSLGLGSLIRVASIVMLERHTRHTLAVVKGSIGDV